MDSQTYKHFSKLPGDKIDSYLLDHIKESREELMKHFEFGLKVFMTQGCCDNFGKHMQNIIKYNGRELDWFKEAKILRQNYPFCANHMNIPEYFATECINDLDEYTEIEHDDIGFFLPQDIEHYDITDLMIDALDINAYAKDQLPFEYIIENLSKGYHLKRAGDLIVR